MSMSMQQIEPDPYHGLLYRGDIGCTTSWRQKRKMAASMTRVRTVRCTRRVHSALQVVLPGHSTRIRQSVNCQLADDSRTAARQPRTGEVSTPPVSSSDVTRMPPRTIILTE